MVLYSGLFYIYGVLCAEEVPYQGTIDDKRKTLWIWKNITHPPAVILLQLYKQIIRNNVINVLLLIGPVLTKASVQIDQMWYV